MAQLLTLYSTLSGVQCREDTGARPLLGQRPGTEAAWLLVQVQSIIELGTDELLVQYNAATGNNDEYLVGQRTFTCVMQAFSLDATLKAYDLLERVRFRLRTATARALMVPTIGLRDFMPVQALPPIVPATPGGHIVLRASLDVRLNCVLGAPPNDPGGGDVIATAVVPPPTIGGGPGNLEP
jgi:hypothetical protein